ncbi:gephyrin-like molybdotransferase Glp [Thalassotalea aquiviva]|uniref:molybdopterin molybdotransferase MoeA n=1 Tax=Thalassotalea aquiviva TaxID=3242415 RepID=UPI00352A92F4
MGCDCHSVNDTLMPFEQALSFLLNTARNANIELSAEQIPLIDALDRILTKPIHSGINVPVHSNSAMDGYGLATAYCDENSEFEVVANVLAGDDFNGELAPHQCVRIMTGAKIPKHVHSVVMQENVCRNGDKITLKKACKAGDNIRLAGEDIQQGALLFEAGRQLSPADMGLLASVGIADVWVQRRLNVAVIATGDELISSGEALTPGKIYESNRFTCIGMLKRLGINVIDMGIVPDDVNLLEKNLLSASEQADVIISSGGVSVGDADYVKDVIEQKGNIGFWKIALKPGKPFAFGQFNQRFFLGLPGNPVSATITLDQLGMPFLKALQSKSLQSPILLTGKLSVALKKRPGRKELQRAWAEPDGQGQWRVTPFNQQGSGILSSISNANCFIVLEREQGAQQEGTEVHFQWLSEELANR